MKKFVVLVCLFTGIVLALGIIPLAKAQAANPQGGADLEVVYIQDFNHVVFTVTWVTDDPDGIWPFLFGDDTQNELVGPFGTATFGHDYVYNPGGVISYTASISLGEWTDPWSDLIVIDDGPTPVIYQSYLPFVLSPTPHDPISTCSIEISEQNINHIVFDVTWSNAGGGIHTFLFGDGTETQQFSGPAGTGSTWHDYPWPETSFTAEMLLDSGGSCSIQVQINWP